MYNKLVWIILLLATLATVVGLGYFVYISKLAIG